MKILLDYDPSTGNITDKNGIAALGFLGFQGFEPEESTTSAPVLELIKQGVTPDEIIKLRNNDLL